MAQKSAIARINAMKKKAKDYDSLKGNFTQVKSSICYWGKKYFGLLIDFQDEDSEDDMTLESLGVNSKHLNILQKHCNISSIADVLKQEETLPAGDTAVQHEDL